jgi:excisionase family DNA binding protein
MATMGERAADRTPDTGQDPAGAPLTAREAAARLGVNERTIRRAIGRGELPATKHAGVYQVTPQHLARYRARRPAHARPPPQLLRLVPSSRLRLARTRTLPAALTPLIGREGEIASALKLLRQPDVRLLTLTGPGGVGKSRLALAVAAELSDAFADGIVFVPLAPVRDSNLVSSAVSQALGVRELHNRPPDEALRDHLRRRELLLILDNFEHLLSAASLVVQLLTECHGIKALVTSRSVLRVYGEHAMRISPFTVPDLTRLPPLEELSRYDTMRLFVERARAAHDDFMLNEENAGAVATICHRLDGLPLAIELAAARSKLLSPQALLDRLDRRMTVLTGGGRDQPDRLRTLRDAIAWSHDLLSPDEQSLFRRLAVFVGGFSPEAAEAVAGSCGSSVLHPLNAAPPSESSERHDPRSALDIVASLLDKSILKRIDQGDGEPRLGMLETIREFALDRLAASGEEEQARRRHAGFFLGLADRSELQFYGPEQSVALACLTREHANLRAALEWALESAEVTTGLRLAVALGRFWHVGGHIGERQQWLERLLESVEDIPAGMHARALCLLGDGAYDTGDLTAAETFYERSLALASQANDRQRIAEALLGLGGIAADLHEDLAAAERHFARSLALREEIGDRWGAALMRVNLADIYTTRGEEKTARSLIEAGLASWRILEYRQGIGRALYLLAQLDEARGDATAALPRYQECLTVWREVGYRAGIAEAATSLGWLTLRGGEHATAASLFAESLAIWGEVGSRKGTASSLESCAAVAAARGQMEAALRLAGTATALRKTIGTSPSALERSRLDPWLRAARQSLGVAMARAAEGAGGTRLVDEAIAEANDALAAAIESVSITDVPAPSLGLTPREQQVLHLVARHYTDREIADALSISPRTTMHHVSHILAKLGVTSRRAAAAWAAGHGFA